MSGAKLVKIDYNVKKELRKTKNGWRFYGQLIFTGLSDQTRRELQLPMPGRRVPSRLCTIETVQFSQQVPDANKTVIHKRMDSRVSDYLHRLDEKGVRGSGKTKTDFETIESILQKLIDEK